MSWQVTRPTPPRRRCESTSAYAGAKAEAVEPETEPAKKVERRLWVHADLKSSPGGSADLIIHRWIMIRPHLNTKYYCQ